jgi:hypothetical protein
MKVIVVNKNQLAIPLNKIDFIKWEEMTGGKALVKVGAGCQSHLLEFDDKEASIAFYENTIKLIEEL